MRLKKLINMEVEIVMSNNQEYWNTNLEKKLFQERTINKGYYLCFWADLLGYGEWLMNSNWNPSDEDVENHVERLRKAHQLFMFDSLPSMGKIILLNDGMCKIMKINKDTHLDEIILIRFQL